MKKYILLLCTVGGVSMTAWTQMPVKPVASVKPGSTSPSSSTGIVSPGSVTPVQNAMSTAPLKNAPTMVTGPQSISGVMPAEGPRATAITISGQKFGNVQSDVQVKINNISAIITGVSDNQITCVVPDKAGSGPISVAVKGKWVTGAYFKYNWAVNVTTLVDGFYSPDGIARDAQGYIYVADVNGNRIQKINSFGEVTTLAGSGTQGFADGMGIAAQFKYPMGVAVDAAGNVYVADNGNNRVRKITPAGMVTTLAGNGTAGNTDGTGTAATFQYIDAICTDPSNGDIYVVNASLIRKISPSGVVKTVAGVPRWNNQLTGPALSVSFLNPQGILVSSNHDIYVTDGTNMVRKISASGMVSTFAGSGQMGLGDGYGNDVKFQGLHGIAMDASGNLYVTESNSAYDVGAMANRVRKIARDGYVSTPTGQNNIFSTAAGIVVDGAGNLIVVDKTNRSIKKITLQ